MSYAIIETGGKQIRVEPGRFYDIELLDVEPDEKVTIDKVLLVKHDDDTHIGKPWVEGATVEGHVMRHFRGRKVIVYKMRPKKKTRKKRGHRQEITRFMIDAIALNGSVLAQSTDEETPVAEAIVETEPAEAATATVVAEEPIAVAEAEVTEPEPVAETTAGSAEE
ncbi:MAG: 50S ribosomal protein L21 [Cyanobacteriota bacterium]|nr:50S ribosomal protein L21 [Cyanobacteriota bacterium]